MNYQNAVHEASCRSEAKGLGRSGMLEVEKRYAFDSCGHRSVLGISFRRAVLTRMSQDKLHVRAKKRLCWLTTAIFDCHKEYGKGELSIYCFNDSFELLPFRTL